MLQCFINDFSEGAFSSPEVGMPVDGGSNSVDRRCGVVNCYFLEHTDDVGSELM